LECGKKIVENGISEAEKKEVIEEYFPKYLKGDQTYRQCSKTHRNFNDLKQITKDCFITQVEEVVKFLKVEEEIDDYDELTKSAYKSKEEAFKALETQLNFNDAGIKVVEKNPSILKVPTGKKVILKVLRKGFEDTKRELMGNIRRIY
jgi:predicted DNA-binding ArsR family transcriptional regulator